MNEIDWRKTYLNYTQSGIDAIDPDSFYQLKIKLLDAWIDLAKEIGLETAIRLFKDDSLRQVLLPELNSWDELGKSVTDIPLVNIFHWFVWLQLVCFAAWLIPGLIVFCRKCLIFKTEWKKHRLYFIVDKPRKVPNEEIQKRESQTSLKQAYTVLHVKNIESEWLPDRLRSMLKKEDKKTRLNREMINEFRRKLLASQEHFQKTMTRTVQTGFLIDDNIGSNGCLDWVSRWLCYKRESVETRGGNAGTKKDFIKLTKRKKKVVVLRKVESAIFAHEYEKERGTVNQHLVASEDRSKSDLYETQSMWDMRK